MRGLIFVNFFGNNRKLLNFRFLYFQHNKYCVTLKHTKINNLVTFKGTKTGKNEIMFSLCDVRQQKKGIKMKVLAANSNQTIYSNNKDKSEIAFGMKFDEKFMTAFDGLFKSHHVNPNRVKNAHLQINELKSINDIFTVSGDLRASSSWDSVTDTLAITVSAEGYKGVKVRPMEDGKPVHYPIVSLSKMVAYLKDSDRLIAELEARQAKKNRNIVTKIIGNIGELFW